MVRQASVEHGVSRLAKRFMAVMCWLWALLMPFGLFVGELHIARWVFVLIMIGVELITIPAGVMFWSAAAETKGDTEQLRQRGRPAIAEIVWLTRIPGRGYGELDTALLRLRISGEGVPPFEATYRCDHQPGFRVGARLDAVVDPSDNLFTLMPI